MEAMELLAFYHWVIIAFGFFLLRVFKLDGISIPGTFAAVMMAVVAYISPDIFWGWQIWGFVLLTAVTAIPYLRQQQREREQEKIVRPSAADTASHMIGTRVTLEEPMASGQSKLLIDGKYWRIAANRDFPAGTTLQVTGHQGAVLNVVSTENASYGNKSNRDSGSARPLADYRRDEGVEAEYGKPNFDAWGLFQAALKAHPHSVLIQAYHVLCAVRGETLVDAKRHLNTHTLALYDPNREGFYIEMYKDMYCDARRYGVFYGTGAWPEGQAGSVEQQVQELESALESAWADLVRGNIPWETVEDSLNALRK